jgi:hypothetical protein
MNTLHFHCGDYSSAPNEAQVLGTILMTGAELSAIGKALRAPTLKDHHVFANSDHIYHGLLISVATKHIFHEHVLIHFHRHGKTNIIRLDDTGTPDDCFDGFFDQAEKDLLSLF